MKYIPGLLAILLCCVFAVQVLAGSDSTTTKSFPHTAKLNAVLSCNTGKRWCFSFGLHFNRAFTYRNVPSFFNSSFVTQCTDESHHEIDKNVKFDYIEDYNVTYTILHSCATRSCRCRRTEYALPPATGANVTTRLDFDLTNKEHNVYREHCEELMSRTTFDETDNRKGDSVVDFCPY